MSKQIPPYITSAEVAQVCEMPTRRVRRLFARAGILERIGFRHYVAESRFRERLPELYARFYEARCLPLAREP